jgi:hypothetical protein
MQMNWYHIFISDLTTSYRVFIARVKAHPIMTLFFVFVAFAGTRLAVMMGLFLDNLDLGENPVYIERWVFSIIYFSFIFGKVALYTYRKVVKECEMLSLFSQPINPVEITIGKFLANFVYISVLIVTGFLLFYGWLVLSLGPIGIPMDIIFEGLILGLLGLALGFTLPVFLQLKPTRLKLLALASNVIIIGSVSIPVRYFTRDLGFFIILTILTVISYILVHYSSRYLLLAWTAQVSKPISGFGTDQGDRLFAESLDQTYLSHEARLIIKKELISLIREKDALVTIFAAVFLTIASVGIYFYFGPGGLEGSSMGKYLYPSILATFLFLGTLMISALIGLAMISVEGRALYIIKSLPVPSREVLKGKSMALLIIGLPIIIPMSVFLPIVAKFPLLVSVFYLIFAIVLTITFTGIGIWSGASFPNFDTTARNMPDLISQFFVMWICIIFTIFLGAIPAYLMIVHNVVGVVAIMIALGWSVAVYLCFLERAKVQYDKISSDMYM